METKQPTIALVTGGGSGIGLAISERFVRHEITTIIVGRDMSKLHAAVQKLGDRCIPLCYDLTKLDTIPTLVKKVIGSVRVYRYTGE